MKGKVIPCRCTKSRIDVGNQQWRVWWEESEAESIRTRAESTGGCVKLKTVTEIRQNVYLVLHSLLDWEPVEKLKQRCDVVSFMFFSA